MPLQISLVRIVIPRDVVSGEKRLAADVRCPCGESTMELMYMDKTSETRSKGDGGDLFIIGACCTGCLKSHVLLDIDFDHFHESLRHSRSQAEEPRPELVAWKCESCSDKRHKILVHITVYERRCVSDRLAGRSELNLWPDRFSFFQLDTTCVGCGLVSPDLFS